MLPGLVDDSLGDRRRSATTAPARRASCQLEAQVGGRRVPWRRSEDASCPLMGHQRSDSLRRSSRARVNGTAMTSDAPSGRAAEWIPTWRRSPTRGRTQQGAWATLRRGLALSPEFRAGLPVTLLLAFGATVGRVLVPIAVQQTIDNGLLGAGRAGPGPGARGRAAGRGRHRARRRSARLPAQRPAVPDHRERPGHPAGARLPPRARPVGADPERRAPRARWCPG